MKLACLRTVAAVGIGGLFLVSMVTESNGEGTTGVEGTVSLSPARPGPLRKGAEASAPAGNVEFIVKQNDRKVATFTTDAAGRFRVSLSPGHYTVLREDPGASAGHWRFEVDVGHGQFTKVSWMADSGMR